MHAQYVAYKLFANVLNIADSREMKISVLKQELSECLQLCLPQMDLHQTRYSLRLGLLFPDSKHKAPRLASRCVHVAISSSLVLAGCVRLNRCWTLIFLRLVMARPLRSPVMTNVN